MKHTVAVVNPRAGSGRGRAVWQGLLDAEPKLAKARLILEADSHRAGGALDALLAEGEVRRVIVVGGDGSVHAVANRMLDAGTDAALAIVPAGTGSDLARSLGLPKVPSQALARALARTPRAVDAIRVEPRGGGHRWVVNIVSAGVSGLVVQRVNSQAVRRRTAYLTASLKSVLGYREPAVEVRVDGREVYRGPLFLMVVANGRAFGKGMRVAPTAEVDDGLADVVVVPRPALWRIPLDMPRLYRGTHLEIPGVVHERGRSVYLDSAEALPPFDVDGESLPGAPCDFRLVPGALQLLA